MTTASAVLKEARGKKGRSLKEVSQETKIKEKFLAALEEEDYSALPGFPVALGFAKSAAAAVGADADLVAALVRRDFPREEVPKKGREMPLIPRSFWTPRTTILATGILTVLVLGGYLVRQYLNFSSPPPLEVRSVNAQDGRVQVQGKTMPSATIEVNGRPVLVSQDGSFYFEGESSEEGIVEIQAESRTGKKTVVRKQLVD